MIYLIIRKFHIKNSNMKPDYRVEKYAETVKEANKYLSALTLLEDNENMMFFIVPAQENPALILTDEVETKANGKEVNITEDMPF